MISHYQFGSVISDLENLDSSVLCLIFSACQLQSAMEYVFGSTFVCKTIDAAREVSREMQYLQYYNLILLYFSLSLCFHLVNKHTGLQKLCSSTKERLLKLRVCWKLRELMILHVLI